MAEAGGDSLNEVLPGQRGVAGMTRRDDMESWVASSPEVCHLICSSPSFLVGQLSCRGGSAVPEDVLSKSGASAVGARRVSLLPRDGTRSVSGVRLFGSWNV